MDCVETYCCHLLTTYMCTHIFFEEREEESVNTTNRDIACVWVETYCCHLLTTYMCTHIVCEEREDELVKTRNRDTLYACVRWDLLLAPVGNIHVCVYIV